MMNIVINASPLILLSRINRLHLLNKLFDKVVMPDAVVQEILAADSKEAGINLSTII
jgi:predicted nucleic acid-binding protein